MAKRDGIQVKGNVVVELRDAATGRLLRREERHNLVVNTGLQLLRDMLGGLRRWPTHMAIGTGTTAVLATDTEMENQAYQDLITRRVQQTYGVRFQLYVPADASSANDKAITEAGLKTVVGEIETLFARVTFDAFNKNSGNTLTVTWTHTFSAVESDS